MQTQSSQETSPKTSREEEDALHRSRKKIKDDPAGHGFAGHGELQIIPCRRVTWGF